MVKTYIARKSSVQGSEAAKWIIWGGAAITLFFWPSFNDPFNAPKSWILAIAAFWLLGWLFFQVKSQISIAPLKLATSIAIAYSVALSISFIATDNSYIGFFGDYQRRTGYISYISLTIFFLASTYIFRIDRLALLDRVSIFVPIFIGVYGILQHYKHDFVHWNNPYNPVIATLGNPDFAGAIMAIFLVLNFGILIQSKRSLLVRIFTALNVVLLSIAIIFSQARQGLITSSIGVVFILIVWSYQKSKSIAYGLASLSLITGAIGTAGMLNKGPLVKFFYKASVSYRGDYWRAGWRMFIHHPLLGVGLDRYGAYFRQYRDATQSLRRGSDTVSNNAHNVPLQLAATGGIIVFITFLLLTFFIAWRGFIALRKSQGGQQIVIAGILAAWITYEIQSFISIDNLAIAIWGYILGGIVVGISLLPGQVKEVPLRTSNTQQFASLVLVLLPFIATTLFIKGEVAMHADAASKSPTSQADLPAYEQFLNKPLSFNFKDPQFQFNIAVKEARVADFNPAITLLKDTIADDPRSYNATVTLAQIYEYQKNWAPAIALRKKIIMIDPFNQGNLLQLGIDEKSSGNVAAAKAVIPLINAFAPNSNEAKQAAIDLGK